MTGQIAAGMVGAILMGIFVIAGIIGLVLRILR